MVRVGNDRRWVQFGPYRADLRARELCKHGVRTKVQARPFEILAMLLERPGDVVTREEIRVQLWPDGTFVDFDSNISSAVRKLRDTLCDSASQPRYIETVGRVGYRFIGQAEFAGDQPVGSPVSSLYEPSTVSGHDFSRAEPRPDRTWPLGPEGNNLDTDTLCGNSSANLPDAIRRLRSRRFALLAILMIAIVIPLVGMSRRWLRIVTAAGSTGASVSRSTQEAAAEYSTGRELWARRRESDLEAAIEHFRLAIAKRPDYGLAYSGLADAYVVLPFYSRVTQAEAYPKAKAAALKAVALAPQSAEAHTSLAYVKLFADADFRGAEQEFRIALQQNPNYATALQWYAEYLSLIGRFHEAISEINRAIGLMPDSPVMHHNAGQIYQAARLYDEAIAEYRTALRLDPTFATSHVFMALAYARKGMYDKAMELQMENAVEMGDPTRIAIVHRLADSYRVNGFEGYQRELLAIELEENPDRDLYRIAHCYALLGEKDLAFQYLERAYQLHASNLLTMNVDPELDSLRSDPRFLALRRRVGLPIPPVELF